MHRAGLTTIPDWHGECLNPRMIKPSNKSSFREKLRAENTLLQKTNGKHKKGENI